MESGQAVKLSDATDSSLPATTRPTVSFVMMARQGSTSSQVADRPTVAVEPSIAVVDVYERDIGRYIGLSVGLTMSNDLKYILLTDCWTRIPNRMCSHAVTGGCFEARG